MSELRKSLSLRDYQALRKSAGWAVLADEQALAGLNHTYLLISCYEADRIAGAARLLWDRGHIAYLTDVIVMPEFQGRGIGKTIVRELISSFTSQLPEGWIVKLSVLAARGRESFYQQFGFQTRPNEADGAGMDMRLTR